MEGSDKPLIRLRMKSKDADTAYIELPGYPKDLVPGCVARTLELAALVDYSGPKIFLDINAENRLIGIEILVWGDGDDQS